MSVRAYRQITEPELAAEATFNLSRNQEVLEKLEDLPGTTIMGGEWTISCIELLASELERLLESSPFDADITQAFQKDIQAVKAKGEEYLLYYCY